MIRVVPLALVALLLVGCATSSSTVSDAGNSSQSELEALYWARQDSARMAFTPADTEFMTGMIAHHAQALVMSELAPDRANTRQVRTLAARIINAQKDEIATMQRWLRDRDQPVPEVHIDGLNLMIHGAGDHAMHTHMPGMLSRQQLEELAASTGPEFDRLFLTFMIQHHSGAIVMADKLFNTDGAAQDEGSFRLATDIRVDQVTEIARMRVMLESLFPSTQDG